MSPLAFALALSALGSSSLLAPISNPASSPPVLSKAPAPLSITAPPDATVASGESIEPAALGRATAVGLAPQSMQITYRDVTVGSASSPYDPVERTIRRIWTANDVLGRSSHATQIIKLLRKNTALDVRPGSCPNEYALGSASALTVSLLGHAEFDVRDVDPTSIEMWIESSGDGPIRPETTKIEDNAAPYVAEDGGCHSAKSDGHMDLSMRFTKQALLNGLHLKSFPQKAVLRVVVTGKRSDGTTFRATDTLRLR